jgi:hypothetical protein
VQPSSSNQVKAVADQGIETAASTEASATIRAGIPAMIQAAKAGSTMMRTNAVVQYKIFTNNNL